MKQSNSERGMRPRCWDVKRLNLYLYIYLKNNNNIYEKNA